mmetsp:Transcript_19886/g.45161  ORF Transcript_19886/g.45161 Transcript_19886/m.45161 type:complete len:129 (+) Transcript_19886:331-717(+)
MTNKLCTHRPSHRRHWRPPPLPSVLEVEEGSFETAGAAGRPSQALHTVENHRVSDVFVFPDNSKKQKITVFARGMVFCLKYIQLEYSPAMFKTLHCHICQSFHISHAMVRSVSGPHDSSSCTVLVSDV